MAPPDAELLEKLRAALDPRAEICEAYVFGSVARGEPHPGSDLDIAVYVDPAALAAPGFGYDAELGADLQRALGRSDVDLVVLNSAPPLLYYRVLRDGLRLLTRDPAATTTREGYALSRYCDYLPQLAKIERAHAERSGRRSQGR
jgi:predicted nucleotidyltransferase